MELVLAGKTPVEDLLYLSGNGVEYLAQVNGRSERRTICLWICACRVSNAGRGLTSIIFIISTE